MKRIESEFYFEDRTLKYLFQESKQDRRHLLVVFSGFGANTSIDYDFIGEPAYSCRSNILWIKDDINNECTYYLCENAQFNIEKAVLSLIDTTIEELNISRDMCTLMGFSKGGSAALYYGLKYNFKNIISSCPQLLIGSYAVKNWPQVATHMFGKSVADDTISIADRLIPDLLKGDSNLDRNIYLISSPNDEQFSNEIEPYLCHFFKYKNFSFVFTESSLAWQHNKVTRYNLPIILSIVYAHGDGIYPVFGQVTNGIDQKKIQANTNSVKIYPNKGQGVAHFTGMKIQDGRIFPQGVAFIKGIECSNYSDIMHTLIIEGCGGLFEFKLGKIIDKDINYKYYEHIYYDYSAASFTSIAHKGLDIKSIPNGKYDLKIRIHTDSQTLCLPIKSLHKISSLVIDGNRSMHFSSFSSGAKLIISDTICDEDIFVFYVKDKWYENGRLHYEGVFSIKGVEVIDWGDAIYLLILKNTSKTFTFRLGMRDVAALNELYKEDLGIYQKSYFCSLSGQGVDVSGVPGGTYKVYISMIHNGHTYTQYAGDDIKF
ncbi:accessory Sec system protein Asp2 [Aeromonas allosaccharophila]|uniref:Accessory Sec system protein Asp2 n=1 Tax=Aeromonas allosaccharophila TaxID=656 RepID=A0ABZ0F5U0_9GAMM|nr:accessory Sec system protein Asp2 [Aeromonas allosaccharophila]WOE64964.1 accessory Sec system protein Asp2 [Aeromonas allosaccharophila]